MSDESPTAELAELRDRVARLEREVAELRTAAAPRPAAAAPPPARPAVAPPASPIPAVLATVRVPAPRRERNPVVAVAAVGAGILLLGSIFLLRHAIQQGWVGPTARFLFGLALGAGLSAVAARKLLAGAPKLGTALLAAGLGTLEFTFYVGAFSYDFYPGSWGFGLVALGCVAAGALATRARAQGAFLVAYAAAFVAPFVFSSRSGNWTLLSLYELSLLAAAVLVAHVAPEARRWGWTRWAVNASQGLLQLGVAAGASVRFEPELFLLLGVALALAAIWIWRPAPDGPAKSPTSLWISFSLTALLAAWLHWDHLNWSEATFALPVLALAALQIAIAAPARRSWARPGGELGLLVVAGALALVAVPIALDWSWVGPLWGFLAVGARLGALRLDERGEAARPEAVALRWVGLGLAASATVRWLVIVATETDAHRALVIPILNQGFITAMLVAVALHMVALSPTWERYAGFVGVEGVLNLAAAFEVARFLARFGASNRAQLIAITIVWALSGAGQWLAGLRREEGELRRGLVAAGYLGLAAAAAKLVLVDLEGSSTALRAVAFLLSGGIFLGAALLAHRFGEGREEPS